MPAGPPPSWWRWSRSSVFKDRILSSTDTSGSKGTLCSPEKTTEISREPVLGGPVQCNQKDLFLILHDEHRAHCTSISSDSSSEDFIPVHNTSKKSVEVCVTLQGYSFPDHQWTTIKLVMLDDVAGSLILSMAPPDSFTCPVWSCSYPWRQHGEGLGAQVPLEDTGPTCHPYGVCVLQFVQKLCSFLRKGADNGPVAGLLPFYSRVQLSLCNSWYLLQSPETLLGDTPNIFGMTHKDVPS